MSLRFPRTDHPVAQGRPERFSGEWLRWLRDLWRSLGFDVDAPIYKDLAVSGAGLNLDGSGASMATFVGSVLMPSFPDGSSNASYFGVELPNSYRDGTDLKPFLRWAPSSAAAGAVAWELEVASGGDGDAITTSTTESATSTAPGVSHQVTRADFDDIDGDDLVRGSVLSCRLSRLGGAAGDTYAADAFALTVGFKYQSDGIGSPEVHP